MSSPVDRCFQRARLSDVQYRLAARELVEQMYS